MFRELNILKPFLEDNYRRISVREYAKILSLSPATASKILTNYHKQRLLKKEEDKMYIYYTAERENIFFRDLSRIYWRFLLEKSGLLDFFRKEFAAPIVILFGSCAKAEVGPHSDIDIVIFSHGEKQFDLSSFEKKLKRNIQFFQFKSREDVDNKQLLNNILNGYLLVGSW